MFAPDLIAIEFSHRYVEVFTQQVIGLLGPIVGLQKAVTTQRGRKDTIIVLIISIKVPYGLSFQSTSPTISLGRDRGIETTVSQSKCHSPDELSPV